MTKTLNVLRWAFFSVLCLATFLLPFIAATHAKGASINLALIAFTGGLCGCLVLAKWE